jgi:N-acetyl-anhydromuramyl-L-alanine amidase AmpD
MRVEYSKTKIILHHSASTFGDVFQVVDWHAERDFDTIGYHFVVLNGHIRPNSYSRHNDGLIQFGRDLKYQGAHAKGANQSSIGVCLIGNSSFSRAQVESTVFLCGLLCELFKISPEEIWGHNHVTEGTECPGSLDIDFIRAMVGLKLGRDHTLWAA